MKRKRFDDENTYKDRNLCTGGSHCHFMSFVILLVTIMAMILSICIESEDRDPNESEHKPGNYNGGIMSWLAPMKGDNNTLNAGKIDRFRPSLVRGIVNSTNKSFKKETLQDNDYTVVRKLFDDSDTTTTANNGLNVATYDADYDTETSSSVSPVAVISGMAVLLQTLWACIVYRHRLARATEQAKEEEKEEESENELVVAKFDRPYATNRMRNKNVILFGDNDNQEGNYCDNEVVVFDIEETTLAPPPLPPLRPSISYIDVETKKRRRRMMANRNKRMVGITTIVEEDEYDDDNSEKEKQEEMNCVMVMGNFSDQAETE